MVVEARHHRPGHAPGNAAVQGVEILHGVEPAAGKRGDVPPALQRLLLRRHRRQAPVRRIDDQRRSRTEATPLHPVVVVGADRNRRPRSGRAVAFVEVDAEGDLLIPYGVLLGRQELLVREVGGPLQRRRGGVGPRPLQVGITPRRTERRPACRRGRCSLAGHHHRREQHDRQDGGQRNGISITHGPCLLAPIIHPALLRRMPSFVQRHNSDRSPGAFGNVHGKRDNPRRRRGRQPGRDS